MVYSPLLFALLFGAQPRPFGDAPGQRQKDAAHRRDLAKIERGEKIIR